MIRIIKKSRRKNGEIYLKFGVWPPDAQPGDPPDIINDMRLRWVVPSGPVTQLNRRVIAGLKYLQRDDTGEWVPAEEAKANGYPLRGTIYTPAEWIRKSLRERLERYYRVWNLGTRRRDESDPQLDSEPVDGNLPAEFKSLDTL